MWDDPLPIQNHYSLVKEKKRGKRRVGEYGTLKGRVWSNEFLDYRRVFA